MKNEPVDLDQEFKNIIDLNKPKHPPIPKFLGERNMQLEPVYNSVRESVLGHASQIATNDRQALYGDQTELNQCVGMLHRWMIKYRPERMQDGEFTQWLSNANEMGKIFKSPVNNSEPYTSFAAGIGIAAECAANEDKQ